MTVSDQEIISLLMAGTKDHYVPLHMLGDQVLTLTAAQSVSARAVTVQFAAIGGSLIGNHIRGAGKLVTGNGGN
jgi:hypothetical protein